MVITPPSVVRVRGELAEGIFEIIASPDGERLRFTANQLPAGAKVVAMINRPGGRVENLTLVPQAGTKAILVSSLAPAEPHKFDARLQVRVGSRGDFAVPNSRASRSCSLSIEACGQRST